MKSTPLFTVDVGNTRTKFALWNVAEKGGASFQSIASSVKYTLPCLEFADSSDSYEYAEEKLTELDFPKEQGVRWVISSVNPTHSLRLIETIRRVRPDDEIKTVVLEDVPLTVRYDCPTKLGIDRAVAAYAGLELLGRGRPFLTVDVGTAATIDYVDPEGVFRGGAILPGPRMSAVALQANTASLPLIDDPENERLARSFNFVNIQKTLAYPATETKKAIRLGVVFTLVGAIEAFYWQTRRRIQDSGNNPDLLALILAGGDAELTKFYLNSYFDDLDVALGVPVPRPEIVIEPRLVHLGLKNIVCSCKNK